ncbi:helix-turn-helix domain-containing protein [Babesia caballi]|uniref:Helix-turn-helix domain-containing protein n=1 Tax=Babesia caballi TaxID=5871 RepID=A0AAV4LUJ2_BABCB|nr:helix-turn-helix domain-containing protein [Babesia caballi]
MGKKWARIFVHCLLALAAQLWSEYAVAARRAAGGRGGPTRRPGLGVARTHLTAFLGPTRVGRRSLRCGTGEERVEESQRERFIKEVRHYDQFPKCAEGAYAFKYLDVERGQLISGDVGYDNVLALVGAIGAVDHFVLLPKGELQLALHGGGDAHGEGWAGGLAAESCVSNFTLAMLQGYSGKDLAAEQYMQQLRQREFKVLTVDQLMESTRPADAATEREAFLSGFNALMRQRGIEQQCLEPIGWKYVPTQKLVQAFARVLPGDQVVAWVFQVYPGDKCPVTHNAAVKLYEAAQGEEAAGEAKKQKWRPSLLARCSICTLGVPPFRFGSLKDVELSMGRAVSAKGHHHEVGAARGLEDKEQFIKVSGYGKVRLNLMIKMMRALDGALEKVQSAYSVDDPKSLTVRGDPFPRPFWVQMLRILLNGKYFKFLPLLVFYVENEGRYHLCTRGIEVRPIRAPEVWNPWEKMYLTRNLDLVPKMYRGVEFANTHDFEITKEQIEHLLALYKPLAHLDISGGGRDPEKQAAKVVHIEFGRQYMRTKRLAGARWGRQVVADQGVAQPVAGGGDYVSHEACERGRAQGARGAFGGAPGQVLVDELPRRRLVQQAEPVATHVLVQAQAAGEEALGGYRLQELAQLLHVDRAGAHEGKDVVDEPLGHEAGSMRALVFRTTASRSSGTAGKAACRASRVGRSSDKATEATVAVNCGALAQPARNGRLRDLGAAVHQFLRGHLTGLRDHLHEPDAASVVVERQGLAVGGQGAGRVLFQVHSLYPDFSAAAEENMAVAADGVARLGQLVALREVGVRVHLAFEGRRGAGLARKGVAGGQAVQDGQRRESRECADLPFAHGARELVRAFEGACAGCSGEVVLGVAVGGATALVVDANIFFKLYAAVLL